MISEPIVFVLGAGSMKDYGFPIGWELVKEVISHKISGALICFVTMSNGSDQEHFPVAPARK
jgi:hypothetical protein